MQEIIPKEDRGEVVSALTRAELVEICNVDKDHKVSYVDRMPIKSLKLATKFKPDMFLGLLKAYLAR